MKEKLNSIYPVVNAALIISMLIFKSIDYIFLLLVLILNIIVLSISLKEETEAKVGTKIFEVIMLVLAICFVLYKLYEIII
jgi:hypothetical protein